MNRLSGLTETVAVHEIPITPEFELSIKSRPGATAKARACEPIAYSLQSHAGIIPMAYKPMMSESECRRRLAWQNKVHEDMKAKKRISITIRGRKFIIKQNVFPPSSWDSNILAKTVLGEVKTGDKVLDMGTGSGIQAILAASKSKNITAVDVNPFAVRCAKLNVKLNKLSTRVKVMESDLFAKVNGKFDFIIFDPPFRWSEPRDILERSTADKNYETLKKFFSTAKKYLNQDGRIAMLFGTSGDMGYFKYLIKKGGFRSRKILSTKKNRIGWTYHTFKLTPL